MKLGAYETLGEIGRGGMGLVLRARAPDGRDVALKLLIRADAKAALERFDRERRLLASLGDAEGFVPLLDAATSPHGPYLVMPFVSGGTLRGRMKDGPLPVDEALRILVAVADAVGLAHAKGVVHRDLKPENVLFEGDRPLVADLGLAKHFAPTGAASASLSKTNELRGTLGYMAPEQMEDAKRVGPPADVFALGAILYECVAGVEAFPGDSPQEVFMHVAAAEHEPLRDVRPDVPRWLDALVERCLARAPERRFPDGAALAAALRAKDAGASSRAPRIGATLLAVLGLAGAGAWAATRPAVPAAPPPAPAPAPMPAVARPADRRNELPDPLRHFPKGTSGLRVLNVLGRPEWNASDQLEGFAQSLDQTRVLAGGLDGRAFLFDVASGRELWSLRVPAALASCALSPDGARAYVAGFDGQVHVADAATGRALYAFPAAPPVFGLAVSADSTRVLAGQGDGTLKLHDAVERRDLATLAGHEGPVPGVRFFQDGRRAVSAGDDKTVRVWDLAGGVERRRLVGHEAEVGALAVLPGEKRIVSGGLDRTLKVFDVETGKLERTIGGHESYVRWVAPSGDGRRALTASWDGRVRHFDLETGALLTTILVRPGRRLYGAGYLPGEKQAISVGWEGRVRTWDLASGTAAVASGVGHEGFVRGVAAASDGTIHSVGLDGTARSWPPRGDRPSRVLDPPNQGALLCVAVSDDGEALAIGAETGRILLGSTRDAALRGVEFGGGAVLAVAWAHDGKRVLAGGNVPRIFDAATGKRSAELPSRENEVRGFGPFPDDRMGLVAFADGELSFFDLQGAPAWAFATRTAEGVVPCRSFGVQRDGKHCVVGGGDGLVRIWEPTGSAPLLATLAGHKGPVTCAALSPDARFAATGAATGELFVWDVRRKALLDKLDLALVNDAPTALAFGAPDLLAVGTGRGLVLRIRVGK